jgi:tyrosyl-tRNA synthetase
MDLVRSFAMEICMEEELAQLLAKKPNPVAYDGFEPSGRMHIAQVTVRNLQSRLNYQAFQDELGQSNLDMVFRE